VTQIIDIEEPLDPVVELTPSAKLMAFWREHPEARNLYELANVPGFATAVTNEL
jgi:hypothetical protein